MDRSASGFCRRMQLARDGRADGLSELVETYRNYVGLLAATSLRSGIQAKVDPSDVVQETFLKVHRSFRQFRGTTSPPMPRCATTSSCVKRPPAVSIA